MRDAFTISPCGGIRMNKRIELPNPDQPFLRNFTDPTRGEFVSRRMAEEVAGVSAPYAARRYGTQAKNALHRSWLINFAGGLFALTMHKFILRDALSTQTGLQANIEMLGVIGAFACIMAATWQVRRKPVSSTVFLCFCTFAVFALASSWRSFYAPLSVVKGILLLIVLCTTYLASETGYGQQFVRAIYWSYIALLGLGVAVGLLFPAAFPLFSIDEFSGRTRMSVYMTHPGVLGETLALFLLIAPLIRPKVGWVSQAFLFVMMVLAGGKTSTGLFCLLFVIRFLSQARQVRSWRTPVIVVALASASVFAAFSLLGSESKVSQALTHSAESIYGTQVTSEAKGMDGRLDLWIAGAKLLGDAQLLGYGLEGTREAMIRVASWSGGSHSGYLELALSAGVLGSLFFFFGLAVVIRACFRARGPLRVNSALMLIYILLVASIGGILNAGSFFGLIMLLWLSYELQPAMAGAEQRHSLQT